MMKRLLIAAIFAIGAMWAPVMAADLDAVEAAPAPIEVPAGFNWSGAYVGGVGAYGWGDVHDKANPAATSKDIDGGLGGVTLGYNYQFNNGFVLGAEADATFGDVGKKWGGENQYDPYFGEDKMTSFGTVRLRAGYAFDWFMPYVTGGLAWGHFEHSLGCDANRVVATNGCQNRRGGSAFETTASDTDIGYTIGAGAEAAVTSNVTIKAEYLFSDFGKHSVTLTDPNYPRLGERDFDTQTHMVRVGLNYKF